MIKWVYTVKIWKCTLFLLNFLKHNSLQERLLCRKYKAKFKTYWKKLLFNKLCWATEWKRQVQYVLPLPKFLPLLESWLMNYRQYFLLYQPILLVTAWILLLESSRLKAKMKELTCFHRNHKVNLRFEAS